MAQTLLELSKKFATRTNQPYNGVFLDVDNSNLAFQCFESALSYIQASHNWKPSLVLDYAIAADGAIDIFSLPDDFINMATAWIYDKSIMLRLPQGAPEDILNSRMLNLKGEPLLKWCVIDSKLVFSFPPQAGADLRMSYNSDGLVDNYVADDGLYVRGNTFKSSSDKFVIDDELLLLGAQWKYASQLGFQDAAGLETEFNKRLAWVLRRKNQPFVKSLGGKGRNPHLSALIANTTPGVGFGL